MNTYNVSVDHICTYLMVISAQSKHEAEAVARVHMRDDTTEWLTAEQLDERLHITEIYTEEETDE